MRKETVEKILEKHGNTFGPAKEEKDVEKLVYFYSENFDIEEDFCEMNCWEHVLEVVTIKEDSKEYAHVPYGEINEFRLSIAP